VTDTAAPAETPAGPDTWLVGQDHPWEALRAPFADDEIAYKPQPISKDIKVRGNCAAGQKVKHGESMIPVSRDGIFCGGYHAPSVHLTYVGHAALTERLDAVCGPENWNWEPFAVGPDGLPAIKDGSLWIRLTIWGVTKIGVGDHEGQAGPVAHKVMIGDALRNAGMRFGIARYLWDKSEKAREQARQERGDDDRQELPASRPAQRQRGGQQPEGEDPWAVAPVRPTGRAALDAAVRADQVEQLASLWHSVIADGREHGPQTVTVKDMARDELRILGISGPVEITDVLRRIKAHLEVEGISVRDHVAAEAADVPASKEGSGK
jgi:hypothetical protein